MKLGQFVCLGNLQRLKNRFGSGYAVQVKLPVKDVESFKEEMRANVPGVEVQGKWTLFDNVLLTTLFICRRAQRNAVLQRPVFSGELLGAQKKWSCDESGEYF